MIKSLLLPIIFLVVQNSPVFGQADSESSFNKLSAFYKKFLAENDTANLVRNFSNRAVTADVQYVLPEGFEFLRFGGFISKASFLKLIKMQNAKNIEQLNNEFSNDGSEVDVTCFYKKVGKKIKRIEVHFRWNNGLGSMSDGVIDK